LDAQAAANLLCQFCQSPSSPVEAALLKEARVQRQIVLTHKGEGQFFLPLEKGVAEQAQGDDLTDP